MQNYFGISIPSSTPSQPGGLGIYNALRKHELHLVGIQNFTSNSNITSSQNGILCTNTGASGTVVLTLPSIPGNITTDGRLTYYFSVSENYTLRITASNSNTIRMLGAISSANGSIESSSVGSLIEITSYKSNEWIAKPFGSWSIASSTTLNFISGSTDITAASGNHDINITGVLGIKRINRAVFWITENGVNVGNSTVNLSELKFYSSDAFRSSSLGSDLLGRHSLNTGIAPFEFVSANLDAVTAFGATELSIDSTAGFLDDDLVVITDGTDYEFQRISTVDNINSDLELENTILLPAGYVSGDDVSRVLELADFAYQDRDGTGEIHLRIIPRTSDDDFRLHYMFSWE